MSMSFDRKVPHCELSVYLLAGTILLPGQIIVQRLMKFMIKQIDLLRMYPLALRNRIQ